MEFKRQSKRSTKQDETININLFLKNFDFGVVTSKYWGDFEEREEPLIEIYLDGKNHQLGLEEFKQKLRMVL